MPNDDAGRHAEHTHACAWLPSLSLCVNCRSPLLPETVLAHPHSLCLQVSSCDRAAGGTQGAGTHQPLGGPVYQVGRDSTAGRPLASTPRPPRAVSFVKPPPGCPSTRDTFHGVAPSRTHIDGLLRGAGRRRPRLVPRRRRPRGAPATRAAAGGGGGSTHTAAAQQPTAAAAVGCRRTRGAPAAGGSRHLAHRGQAEPLRWGRGRQAISVWNGCHASASCATCSSPSPSPSSSSSPSASSSSSSSSSSGHCRTAVTTGRAAHRAPAGCPRGGRGANERRPACGCSSSSGCRLLVLLCRRSRRVPPQSAAAPFAAAGGASGLARGEGAAVRVPARWPCGGRRCARGFDASRAHPPE